MYKSKHDFSRPMIPDLIYINDKENDKDHFAAISSISRLLFGLRSKLKGTHYCRNCLNEFRSELVLDKHSKICEDNDYCEIIMPSKKKSKLIFDLSKDTSMTLRSIYAELQSISVPITNEYLSINGKESYTIKENEHMPSGFALSTIFSSDTSKSYHTHGFGEDCMNQFVEQLKEHIDKITNYEESEKEQLTHEQLKEYLDEKQCHICKLDFHRNESNQDHYKQNHFSYYTGKYKGAFHYICVTKTWKIKEIPVIFHNRSRYDDHLIIKELAKHFKNNFACIGQNSETYITFSFKYKKIEIKFIDSLRFMNAALSSLVDNLAETFKKDCKDCKSPLDYTNIQEEKLIYKCNKCNKEHKYKLDKTLIQEFPSLFNFVNKDSHKFHLLLRKGFYPYEYMTNFEKFNESKLPPK